MCPEFNYKDHMCSVDEANELLCSKKQHGWQEYFETKEYLKSIEGKYVNLVFTAGAAFEKEDNNHWLPHSLWVAV